MTVSYPSTHLSKVVSLLDDVPVSYGVHRLSLYGESMVPGAILRKKSR